MTAPGWLEHRATRSPGEVAVWTQGRSIRWAQLAARARNRALALQELGIAAGDVVAVLSETGSAYAELLHAVWLRRAVLLPINARLAPPEIEWQLRESGARVLLHGDGELAERGTAAVRLLEARGGRILLERLPAASDGPDPGHLPSGLEAASAGDRLDRDEPLALLYTSGTDGRSKGALLTERSFFWSALASSMRLGSQPGDRWLACMPFFHVGGLSILMRSAFDGAGVVIHDRFDPESVSRSLDRDGITLVSLVPTTLARLLDVRGARRAPPRLRAVLVGGGPAPPGLLQRAAALGFPVAATYGLTEAASQVATAPPGKLRAGLPPVFGTRLCIAAEDGTPLPVGTPGEILVRSPTVMKGYAGRPEATRHVLRGGWLHTGDVGCLDARGRLRVLDRRRDLIVCGGENVYPAEVEAALLEHPAVAEAAVAGVRDPDYGQRPAAWLVVTPGCQPDPDALRAFCRGRLAGFKIPVRFCFVERLPRTASGKLVRERLA